MNVSGPSDAVPMPVAVVSLCSTPRAPHLLNQLAALAGHADVERIVVWIDDDDPPSMDADRILRVDRGPAGLRLATARNTGATAAIASGAALIVFLDADCVPGADLLDRYRAAALAHPDAVLAGPVTYLPPGSDASDRSALQRATAPHAARPNPPDRTTQMAAADEYPLFWSLSFAMTVATWQRIGGFDEAYEGYGGEDTDFAFTLPQPGGSPGLGRRRTRVPPVPPHFVASVAASRRHSPQRRSVRAAVGRMADDRMAPSVRRGGRREVGWLVMGAIRRCRPRGQRTIHLSELSLRGVGAVGPPRRSGPPRPDPERIRRSPQAHPLRVTGPDPASR